MSSSGPKYKYDKKVMDKAFVGCECLNQPSNFKTEEIDDIIKATFHFDEGYEWRLAEPHERLYHRP